MHFRSDISFLRAISVLIVMFFHFQINGFSGGFIGVDVFFVISGFLMTQIILKGIDSNTFSLKQFYIKRINRIIPPLQILLLFVLLISVVFFFKTDLKLNAKYTFLADFFVSNIYFWRYIDYFSSTDNILLHTWSLGVEWQFYLIYPIFFLFLKSITKNKEKRFWSFVLGLSFLSFLWMIKVSSTDNNFAFYMLPSRFWELSIGGLAYIMGKNNKLNYTPKIVIVTAGIIAIILCSIFINERNIWPSFYTIIPVLSTVAILGMDIDIKIFSNRLVKFFGDISYSLYLWHWPWFILFKYFGFLGGYYTIVLIALSILSAYLSFRLIEKNSKFNNINFAIISSITVASIATIIFFKPNLISSFSIYKSEKFQIADYENKYKETKKDKQFNPCHCFITNSQKIGDYDFKNCLKISTDKKNVLLIGDSHSAQYSSSLRKLRNINLLEASAGYVFPFPDSRGKKDTKQLMDYVFRDFIPQNHKKIDLIIISAHWLMKKNPNLHYSNQEIKSELIRTISYLEKYHINYLFLGQTEAYSISYPKILMLKNLGRTEQDFLINDAQKTNEILKSIIPARHYIDLYESKEINKIDGQGKTPYMFDGNHYSEYGARQVVENIIMKRLN
ncbi:acyltransferase family protein [Epilithonimonas sp.]|uniref:acyltransferase family protein n=1 Tax=Epilithonimonas sp. TaxID=2894511 RepID=UPI0028AA2BFC|nr:acyltransferase family protein [Epilithonimonas sp.]